MQPTINQLEQRIQELENRLEHYRICSVYKILTRPALEEEWHRIRLIPDLAIAFFDLDDLKLANNRFGYDETNRKVAKALSVVRSNEFCLGRFFSGDEMVLFAPLNEISHPCDRLLKSLKDEELSATFIVKEYQGEKLFADAIASLSKLIGQAKYRGKGKIYEYSNLVNYLRGIKF